MSRPSMRLAAICGTLIFLSLAGCNNSTGLFDGNSLLSNGTSAIADHSSDIFSAAQKALSGTSYCQKASSTEVYKVDNGDCASGDTAIKSYEYNERVVENQQAAWDKLHAAAQAEANKPTYCETITSHTAYRPWSGQCQPGEQTINEQEYTAAKAKAAAAWAQVP